MVVRDALAWARSSLRGDMAQREALVLLVDATGLTETALIAHPELPLRETDSAQYRELVATRASGMPLAYVRGWTEWYGHRFTVTPDVLIPRPFTEHLVDLALSIAHAKLIRSVLDVGTGSGAMAIALALSGAFDHVTAIDVSPAAFAIARANAEHLGANIEFIQSDLLEAIDALPPLIVANLPYLPPNMPAKEMGYGETGEPTLALNAENDGEALMRRLISQLTERAWRGDLLLECRDVQVSSLVAFAATHGWHEETMHRITQPDVALLHLVADAAQPESGSASR